MARLIVTQQGQQLTKSLSSDRVFEVQRPTFQASIKPQSFRMRSIAQVCSSVRIKAIKSIDQSYLLTSRSPEIPKISTAATIKRNLSGEKTVVLRKKFDRNSLTRVQTSSIGQHHVNSIRLRNGEWFQWKKLNLEVKLVDQFRNRLKYGHFIIFSFRTEELTEEEERMRSEKKIQKYLDALSRLNQVEELKQRKLDNIKEYRQMHFDLEQDEFWKAYQKEVSNVIFEIFCKSVNLAEQASEIQKARTRLLSRIDQRALLKFRVRLNIDKQNQEQNTQF